MNVSLRSALWTVAAGAAVALVGWFFLAPQGQSPSEFVQGQDAGSAQDEVHAVEAVHFGEQAIETNANGGAASASDTREAGTVEPTDSSGSSPGGLLAELEARLPEGQDYESWTHEDWCVSVGLGILKSPREQPPLERRGLFGEAAVSRALYIQELVARGRRVGIAEAEVNLAVNECGDLFLEAEAVYQTLLEAGRVIAAEKAGRAEVERIEDRAGRMLPIYDEGRFSVHGIAVMSPDGVTRCIVVYADEEESLRSLYRDVELAVGVWTSSVEARLGL